MGSWNAKTSPEAKAYFDAHTKKFGKEPDRWASGHCWAGLRDPAAGGGARSGLDRKALREHIAKNEFKTILGPIRFEGSENASIPGTVAPVAGRRVRGGVAARTAPPRSWSRRSRPGSSSDVV